MSVTKVDVAVIGAGTAGLAARRAAKAAGARAVLINAGPWGTTCARVGCMPSKLLLAAADAARDARAARALGVLTGEVGVDGAAVMARVRAQRDHFLKSLLDEADAMPADEKIDGRARFVGPSTLQVDDRQTIEARAVVIATGSRPDIPDAFKGVDVLTNETVFDLPTLPPSLAVVGAGPLGIELGVAFARLGVRVTVFDQARTLGGLKDPEVNKVACGLMSAELELRLGVELSAAREGDGTRLSWKGDGGAGEAVFARVLMAASRPPDLDGLDLKAAGLDLDRHGVPEHDRRTLRCGRSAVFIAGDASHDLPVLHMANWEGERAGRNAASSLDLKAEPPPVALSMVFTSPDMASVGASLGELGEAVEVGCSDFDSGRRRVEDGPQGLIRLYASEGRLAGAEMVGPAVEHLAQSLAWLIQAGTSVDQALALPFYHPTYEEDLQAALRDMKQARPAR